MLKLQFTPFPELSTERLDLKQMTAADAEDFFVLRSNKHIMKYIERPIAEEVEECRELIRIMDEGIKENNMINWGIYFKGEQQLIGTIGFYRLKPEHFRAEVGYLLHTDHWKKGIMTEALNAIVKYGFEQLKFHSLEADLNPDNLASESLLRKCGFVKEGLLKESYYYGGKFTDTLIYSKLTHVK